MKTSSRSMTTEQMQLQRLRWKTRQSYLRRKKPLPTANVSKAKKITRKRKRCLCCLLRTENDSSIYTWNSGIGRLGSLKRRVVARTFVGLSPRFKYLMIKWHQCEMECKVKVWNLQSKRSKKKKEDPHALCSVFYFKPKAYYASKSFLYLRGTFLDPKKTYEELPNDWGPAGQGLLFRIRILLRFWAVSFSEFRMG